jgi:hypothetical protein
VTAVPVNRDNVLAVADAIEASDDLHFSMRQFFSRVGTDGAIHTPVYHPCQTAACVSGWTSIVMGGGEDGMTFHGQFRTAVWLGGLDVAHPLFFPPGFGSGRDRQGEPYSRLRAIAVLRHLAEAEEVRWDLYDAQGRRR